MIKKQNFINKSVKEIVVEYKNFQENPIVSKDENLLKSTDCIEKYNFNTENGSLKNSVGIKDFSVTVNNVSYNMLPQTTDTLTEIKDIWAAKWLNYSNQNVQDYIFCLADDNKVYYSQFDTPQYNFSLSTTFTADPVMVKINHNNYEKFLFSSENEMTMVGSSGEIVLSSAPKVLDACFHYGKLFALTTGVRNALVYSSNNDITSWTDANVTKIQFTDERGRLLKILNFNDNLYIFREFGITKVDAYSMNSEFGIDHMYQSSSYIFPKTICVCGEKIYFMTTDGLYFFNGNSVDKVDLDIVKKIDKTVGTSMVAEVLQGKYYLSCKISFNDGTIGCESGTYVNNSVIIFDSESQKVEILRGIDVKKFASFNSVNMTKMCAIFREDNKARIGEFNSDQKVFNTTYNKIFKTALTDGGYPNKLKHIREFFIKAKADCSITIETDEESKEYNVTGGTAIQRIKTDVKGRKFRIIIKSTSTSEQEISNLTLTMAVIL